MWAWTPAGDTQQVSGDLGTPPVTIPGGPPGASVHSLWQPLAGPQVQHQTTAGDPQQVLGLLGTPPPATACGPLCASAYSLRAPGHGVTPPPVTAGGSPAPQHTSTGNCWLVPRHGSTSAHPRQQPPRAPGQGSLPPAASHHRTPDAAVDSLLRTLAGSRTWQSTLPFKSWRAPMHTSEPPL